MLSKTNFQAFAVAILLITVGTFSPSNGVDDAINKSPTQLLTSVVLIISTATLVYIIWMWIEQQIAMRKTDIHSKQDQEI